ncbi:hypothetical protein SAMN05216339_1023 [Nitrosomonas eutropha]|uniref:Uncharacterized protein n=1 Tax=Nitrosomonas eutropha TaxID=916 RepID=A0A1I7FU43_9PROT|nr:hypothetical protein [Nitrosomonas eutropha]SFU39688.1 hypothetical protein SAMN05216339_1023 [Nitrosomonas eutropha]
MEMKTYIEMGETKAGSQIALAKYLGQYDSGLRAVKGGKKGLPDAVCIKLADYIGVDRLEVIAASNLVTEKDEERREIFRSCFEKSKERATATIIGSLVISLLTLAPLESREASSPVNLHYDK